MKKALIILMAGVALVSSCSKNDSTNSTTVTPVNSTRLYGSGLTDYIDQNSSTSKLMYQGQTYSYSLINDSTITIYQGIGMVGTARVMTSGSTEELLIPAPSPFGSTVYMSH